MSDKDYQTIQVYCDACRQTMITDDDFVHKLTHANDERAIYVKPCDCERVNDS